MQGPRRGEASPGVGSGGGRGRLGPQPGHRPRAGPGAAALTLRAPWDVPLGRRRPPSSCISEHSSSSSSSMMSDRSEPRLLSVWYSSPWQQCGWGRKGAVSTGCRPGAPASPSRLTGSDAGERRGGLGVRGPRSGAAGVGRAGWAPRCGSGSSTLGNRLFWGPSHSDLSSPAGRRLGLGRWRWGGGWGGGCLCASSGRFRFKQQPVV